MIKPNIKLKGAKVFTNTLNRYVNNLQNQLNDMAQYEGETLYARSQRDVPVLTGELKSTGRVNTKSKKVFVSGFTGGQKSDVKVVEVTYGTDAKKADGYYASYQEFGVGSGMNFSGEYGQESVVRFAELYKNSRTRRRSYTKAKKYLLKNAFLSKRNLERKVTTLAKNL